MLKDVFDLAENQVKGTYSLGYNLTLTRNSDSCVLNKAYATSIAKIKFIGIELFVPRYTPTMQQQKILFKQILSIIPTEL